VTFSTLHGAKVAIRPALLIFFLVAGVLSVTLLPGGSVRAAPADVRVLVDVSGSMKKNDPHNLRAPAVRLLVGLLPDGSRAGVWLFGQGVQALVPVGQVDGAWRERAMRAAARIHSRGRFTDIGRALRTATDDWSGAEPAGNRHVILLTDGMVDVAKDPAVNARARAEVLGPVLAELSASGTRVHTVALSEHADHELLQELALATDAWYERTDDPEQLQRIFLRLFEKSARRDTLPLKENRFSVDASIEEMTLLVFHPAGGRATRVERPDGRAFGREDAPDDVSWAHEGGYDLITVLEPMQGEWRLLADEDPDNRVMVVTDLRLRVGPLPNNLIAGEPLTVTASLLQNDRPIVNPDFLELLEVHAVILPPGAQPRRVSLVDDGEGADATAGDGVFSLALKPPQTEGEHELVVRVDGRTFLREDRQTYNVLASAVIAKVRPLQGAAGAAIPGRYAATVTPRPEVLESSGFSAVARVTGPDGVSEVHPLAPTETGQWRVELADLAPGTDYAVVLEVEAVTRRGRSVTLRSGPYPVSGPPAKPGAAAEAPPAEEGASTLGVVAGLLGANLLMVAVGFAVWQVLRKRRLRLLAELTGSLSP
jgi:uncharacterized protein (TIGR03503 family)